MAASSKPIPTSTDAHNITSTTEATTSSRSSWKSRLMGGGSSSNNATTTSSRPRRSASPGLRRFSHASNCTSRSNSNVGDEKKDDHGDDAVLVASIEVTAEAAADIKAATMNPERTSRSLSASREQRSQKKGMRGRLRQLLPKSNNSNKDTNNRSRSRGSKQRSASPSVREHGEKKKMTGLRRLSLSNKLPPTQQPPPAAALPVAPVAGTATIPPLQLQNESPAASKKISPKSTKSKGRKVNCILWKKNGSHSCVFVFWFWYWLSSSPFPVSMFQLYFLFVSLYCVIILVIIAQKRFCLFMANSWWWWRRARRRWWWCSRIKRERTRRINTEAVHQGARWILSSRRHLRWSSHWCRWCSNVRVGELFGWWCSRSRLRRSSIATHWKVSRTIGLLWWNVRKSNAESHRWRSDRGDCATRWWSGQGGSRGSFFLFLCTFIDRYYWKTGTKHVVQR